MAAYISDSSLNFDGDCQRIRVLRREILLDVNRNVNKDWTFSDKDQWLVFKDRNQGLST